VIESVLLMQADPGSTTLTGPRLEAIEPPKEQRGPTVVSVIEAVGIGCSVALFVAGCLLLAKVRRAVKARKFDAGTERFSAQTRAIAAISAIISGYHLFAWSMRERWFQAPIAADRWWIVVSVALFAIAASAGVDQLHHKFDRETAAK
jgi:hypothetical protein